VENERKPRLQEFFLYTLTRTCLWYLKYILQAHGVCNPLFDTKVTKENMERISYIYRVWMTQK